MSLYHMFSWCRIFECCGLQSRRLELTRQWHFHNCCVLKVKFQICKSTANRFLISAGTDGRLALWKADDLSQEEGEGEGEGESQRQPFASFKIHQSGINGLDCKWAPTAADGDRLMILSGGDDNALTFTLIDVSGDLSSARIVQQQTNLPHAAQISGRLNSPIIHRVCYASLVMSS